MLSARAGTADTCPAVQYPGGSHEPDRASGARSSASFTYPVCPQNPLHGLGTSFSYLYFLKSLTCSFRFDGMAIEVCSENPGKADGQSEAKGGPFLGDVIRVCF